jgi:hypothetical protein
VTYRKVSVVNFDFQHTEKPTGGMKYPRRVDLTAHHPETGEVAGTLRYFPPKRRGGPVTVDELEGLHPGAASALMNEMESRHPGSRVQHANDMPISKEKKLYDHPDYGKATDWETHHPNLPEQIHRGMSIKLDSSSGFVSSGNGTAAEQAEALRHHLTSAPLGMHWSADEKISRNFAHRNIRDPRTEIPVILHADKPDPKHIETRPSVLKNNGVWSHDYEYGDAEVPMRRGKPVTVRGISWKPDAPHPEADEEGWLHHTFSAPIQHRAIRRKTAHQMDGGFEDIADEAPEEEIVTHGAFDPYSLLTLASQDREFKFHFVSAWADVQRKAKRIRSEGGVRITLASDGVVFGEVKGDHNVYETGVQRLPGTRHSVATYTCGCKWGAYHWGASDDFSRFAGRMCSHALALQYEAQSRGMFGRDVKEDAVKPEWVPKRVVIRYDIDSGTNQMVRSSSKIDTPLDLLVTLARAQGDDPEELAFLLRTMGMPVVAAINSPWGEPVPDKPMYTPGPTKPRNPSENPGSSGWATQGDPDNWDSIQPNELGDRVAALGPSDDEFLFEGSLDEDTPQEVDLESAPPEMGVTAAELGPERPSGPKGGQGGRMPPGHPHMPEHEMPEMETEATLHMEPEGALPFTDGDGPDLSDDEALTPPRAASLGAQDIVAQFQATAAHLAPGGSPSGPLSGRGDASEIAGAARAALAKMAVKDYSPAEQAAIINEGAHGVRASNLDRLDIGDTHYALLDDQEDDGWL